MNEPIDAEVEPVETELAVQDEATDIIPRSMAELRLFEEQTKVLELYADAMKKRQAALLKGVYAGDLVAFPGQSGNWNVQITGSAACRLAMLGISIVEITGGQAITHEDEKGKWIEFEYAAVAVYQGRNLPIRSHADTRMKFFGMAKGEQKPLAEINLPDVKTAAWQGLYKAAVRVHFGLKSIPLEIAVKVLQVPLNKIRFVQFGGQPPIPTDLGPSEPAAAPSGGSMVCDQCGKPMRLRKGKTGDFWGCSGYPACKNTKPVKAATEPAQAPKEQELPPPADEPNQEDAIREEVWTNVYIMNPGVDEAKLKSILKVKYACLNLDACTGKALTDLRAKVGSDVAAFQQGGAK